MTPEIKEEIKETLPKEQAVKEAKPKKVTVLTGTVICKALNVRKQPNLDAEILFRLAEGNIVKITNSKDEFFYKVEFEKKVGYCMKKFIKEN